MNLLNKLNKELDLGFTDDDLKNINAEVKKQYFSAVIIKNSPLIYKIIYTFPALLVDNEIDDLFNDCWIHLITHCEKYSAEKSKVTTYIYNLTRNYLIDRLRHTQTQRYSPSEGFIFLDDADTTLDVIQDTLTPAQAELELAVNETLTQAEKDIVEAYVTCNRDLVRVSKLTRKPIYELQFIMGRIRDKLIRFKNK